MKEQVRKYEIEINESLKELDELEPEERDEKITELYEYYRDKVSDNVLEQITDYILRDDLQNTHPDKITNEEYPIMSDGQLYRRRKKEVSLDDFYTIGLDGKDHRGLNRRDFSIEEESEGRE